MRRQKAEGRMQNENTEGEKLKLGKRKAEMGNVMRDA